MIHRPPGQLPAAAGEDEPLEEEPLEEEPVEEEPVEEAPLDDELSDEELFEDDEAAGAETADFCLRESVA